MSESLQPHELQHDRLPCPSLFPWVCSNSCLWLDDAIQPFYSLSPPFPLALNSSSIRVFSSELAHCIRWRKYQNFSISPLNEYSGSISFRIGWFDFLAVQGTQKFSLVPQFEIISSSVLSLYRPTLTSINDYLKDHSFDCMDLCWQSDVSAFQYTV